MSVYRTKGERISMKKFKIKTNLVSGVIMGVAALLLIILLPSQVRVPAFDSGAPSPRIIPGICLAIMLVSSIALIIQSLVLKQEKIVEFDWAKEKPAILLILGMCVYREVLRSIAELDARKAYYRLRDVVGEYTDHGSHAYAGRRQQSLLETP